MTSGGCLSLQHDAVVARLVDFSISRRGPAPVPWAWLDLGSAARREFTLASDQDNALAYAVAGPEIDEYFAGFGGDVNAGLASCGIGVDNNGVLAGNRRWRMSRDDWLRTFQECLTEPDESHLVRASVAFDFRPAAGRAGADRRAERPGEGRPRAPPVHAADRPLGRRACRSRSAFARS